MVKNEANALRGEFLDFKEEIIEEVDDKMCEAKNYLNDYLIDSLDKYLSEKTKPSKLIEYSGIIHPNYWTFVACGGRGILSIIVFPLYICGLTICWIRKKKR